MTLLVTDALTTVIVKSVTFVTVVQTALALAFLIVQHIWVLTLLVTDALTTVIVKSVTLVTVIQTALALALLIIQHIWVLTLPVTDTLTALVVKAIAVGTALRLTNASTFLPAENVWLGAALVVARSFCWLQEDAATENHCQGHQLQHLSLFFCVFLLD